MTIRILPIVGAAVLLAISVGSAAAVDRNAMAAARDLYVSASYEDALNAFDRLETGDLSREERRTVDQYRLSCLVALGRRADAERLIETVVTVDPFSVPSESELSPPVRAVFEDVRRRVLPKVVLGLYAQAKGAYRENDFRSAAAGFREVDRLLATSDVASAIEPRQLADLKVLTSAFRDLSVDAAEPPLLAARRRPIPALSLTIAAPPPAIR